MQSYSQVGQDKFLWKVVFKDFHKGFFIDIGAYDGVTFSNSLFFEKHLGWNGICVEPIKEYADKIKEIRACHIENAGISATEGKMNFLEVVGSPMFSGIVEYMPKKTYKELKSKFKTEEYVIPILPFGGLISKYDVQEVHYLSIDTEGNELNVLKSLDFEKVFVHAISIEDNNNEKKVDKILADNNFIIIKHSIFDKTFINTKSEFFRKRLYLNYGIASLWNIYIGSYLDTLTRPITRKMSFLLKLFK